MPTLEEKKLHRLQFINALYAATDGDRHSYVSMWDIGESAGLTRADTRSAVDYLAGEFLLEHKTLGGGISITHQGVLEVEQALSEPDSPTHYFPPINILHVETMISSQVQQGTQGSSQQLSINQQQLSDFNRFLSTLRDSVKEMGLDPNVTGEIVADIVTIETQTRSPKPKWLIVRESLRSIRTILENAAGSALASGQLPQVMHWLSQLGN